VVHRGFILTRDVEVPLEVMEIAPGGEVRLSYTADRVDTLPEFYEANYTTTPPPTYTPMAGYPAAGLYWPATYGMAPAMPLVDDVDSATRHEVDEALRRQDLDNAVIGEGSDVRSRDGQKVGTLHRLAFDPEKGHLTRFVVRSGFIFTEDTELPAALIASVDDGVIFLATDAAWFDILSELTPGREVWTSDAVLLGTITRREDEYLVVSSLDEARWARIPITRVARLDNSLVTLSIDAAEAARWMSTPEAGPSQSAGDRFA
jgi:hypothetical protein